jgi:hypothetical protein
MRRTLPAAVVGLASILVGSSAHAQTIGVGGRFSMIRGDVEAETSAERFTGGQLRIAVSKKTSVELSVDRRTETNEAGTERSRDYPLQASLLLFAVRSRVSPYVLGGGGWYSHRLDRLDGDKDVIDSEVTRKFGYHGGFGGELRLGRHAGLHADYRYTFLRFGSDDTEGGAADAAARDRENLASRFMPSYEGSMWTAGLTIYF